MKHLSKKTLLLIIGFILLIGLFIANILVQQFRPKIQPEVTNPQIPSVDNKPYSITEFSFVGEKPLFPQTLPLFQAPNQQFSTQRTAEQYAQLLNMDATTSPNTWENVTESTFLTINKLTNQILYRKLEIIPSTNPLTLEDATTQATSFLTSLGITDVSPLKEEASFLSGETEPEEATPNNATMVVLSFQKKLSDYPLFFNNTIARAAEIWVHSKAGIIKADLLPTPQLEQYSTATLINIDDAIQELKKGNGILLSAKVVSGGPFAFSDLASATFTTVSLEYRFSPIKNFAIPYYRFSGNAQTKNGITTFVVLSTPAVFTQASQ